VERPLKKRNTAAIPDFSRKKPLPGGKPVPAAENSRMPDPRQKQSAPTKAKNGGRRGT
jgi:hypothetical protein